jgi:hypothetical protein
MANDEPSTRFPFINLEKALARAHTMFQGNRAGTWMAVQTAFELWGYSPKSSGAFQTVGALKGYGLIDDEGANDDRRIRLTDSARKYFLDERDDVRAGALATFALNPPLFRTLWFKDQWSAGLPADTVARSHLKIERKLNDQSARALLGIFKENMTFAGLKTGESDPRAEAVAAYMDSVALQPSTESTLSPDRQPLQRREIPWVDLPRGRTLSSEQLQPPDTPSTENLIDVRIVGERLLVSANVDLRGLRKLRKRLTMVEAMLLEGDDDEDAAD